MRRIRQILGAVLLILTAFACKSQVREGRVTAMSFNVRYDNSEDAPHTWAKRKALIAQIIQENEVNVLGTQETLHHQLEDLKGLMPDFAVLGVGREDGKTEGEYSALWYKKERFELVNNGHFWLSEQPDSIGMKGWDAVCERIATWAILKDKETAKEFFVLNTHFDHVGMVARAKSVALIKNKVREYAGERPFIIMGDFNADPKDNVVLTMTDAIAKTPAKTPYYDSRLRAKMKKGSDWTFHDFGEIAEQERTRIDYIFVSKAWKVLLNENIRTDKGEIYASDHSAVLTILRLNN